MDVDEAVAIKPFVAPEAQEPAPEPTIAFQDLFVISKQKAALTLDTKLGPIGNCHGPNKGVSMTVSIDAGRLGDPSFTLYFGINNGEKTHYVSSKEDEVDLFEATWHPGYTVRGERMMTSFDFNFVIKDPGRLNKLLKMKSAVEPARCPESVQRMVDLCFENSGSLVIAEI